MNTNNNQSDAIKEFKIIEGAINESEGIFLYNITKENYIILDGTWLAIWLLKSEDYYFVEINKNSRDINFEIKSWVSRYKVSIILNNEIICNWENSNKIISSYSINKLEQQKILYIDLDNVVVDFESAISLLEEEVLNKYKWRLDEVPWFFSIMKPIKHSVQTIEKLNSKFNIFFLSTAPWENFSAWSDKLLWIKQYFPIIWYKRLILSHHKNLNSWDYLIDDRTSNGAGLFLWEHIQFWCDWFITWQDVDNYLSTKY